MDSTIQKKIEEARIFIKQADAILITAGAGMGVDSGLPDFSGKDGFWRAYPAIKHLGINFEEMANPKWFKTEPELAWAFYGHRLNLYRKTIPHDGFSILLDLVRKKNDDYFIYTSNVDGQFQKAGFDEEKIVEIHGSIHYFQCREQCTNEIWEADKENIPINMEQFRALHIPTCRHCDAVSRPNILMFWDWQWNDIETSRQKERFEKWISNVYKQRQKLAVIEIGAGTALPTIRDKGEQISEMSPYCKLIRINPLESYVHNNKNIGISLGGLEGIRKVCLSNID